MKNELQKDLRFKVDGFTPADLVQLRDIPDLVEYDGLVRALNSAYDEAYAIENRYMTPRIFITIRVVA